MRGLGERLKERARELGLTDSEVARRLGLSQARYSHYANEAHEPDLETLVRVARALGLSADHLLGMTPLPEDGEDGALRARLAAAASGLTGPPLAGAVAMVEAMLTAAPPEYRRQESV
jgi:transcriptional regulator with XRE-family HTH domain